MKHFLYTFILTLLFYSGFSQDAFRLHVQPGKTMLKGDGDDFTTIVVTARNHDGEIIQSVNGTVSIRVSSGFPDELKFSMKSGVAMVKFTAPMFGTPVKSSQRMVYFMFRFMQKFLARSVGSADYQANQKLATDITLETFKEGLNPVALIPQKEGENFVYIVCELNGIRGKAKIEISKDTDGRNGNIIPGVYYGRDITGQSSWILDITSGGEGTFGEASASASESNTILFTNENFTEFNDAMGKMAGMTGFKKAYLGPPEKEAKYYENYNIRENGMPSAYMPMPNHGVFVYIPPVLFEYAGTRRANEKSVTEAELVKTEKTGIVLSQDKIVGDGRSRTKAVFHFEDENGQPVGGKNVNWSIPRNLKVLSVETVTNASGNAIAVIEAPLIKATEEKRGENTKGLYDNYDLFLLKASYVSLSERSETTQTELMVYKTLEQDMFILKPGMEMTPYKVLLPQMEYYNLESSIYALLPESYLNSPGKKTAVNDAVVFLASRNFDRAEFQKKFDLFFMNDREMFIRMLENEKGGYAAITDAAGKYKLIVRDFEGKMRLYSGDYERRLSLEPLEAKIADLTGRHKGALTEALSLLAGGDTEVMSSEAAGESSLNQTLHGLAFKEKVLAKLLNMEQELCSGNYQDALFIQEKLHIIGMLMTNIKGSSRYVSDCANVFGEQAYEAIKFLVFFAAEKYKFNEKIFNKLANTENAQKLKAAGIDLSGYIDNSLTGISEEVAKKGKATEFLLAIVAQIKQLPGDEYYRLLGHAANYALTETQKKMLDAVVDAVVYYSPTRGIIGDMIKKQYYAGQTLEVLKLLEQDPRKVHAVYEQLQLALRDRSTEIRAQYSSVAAWRLNLDDFKAYTDLFADLVAKGAVIIFDAYTVNYAAIEKHLEYIDKAKNLLNAAYHTSSLALEFTSLRNLWAESDAALIYANKCIEQGVMNPIADNSESSFTLFPSALAANGSTINILKGVPALSPQDLKLTGAKLPAKALNQFYNGFGAFSQWFQQNKQALLWMAVAYPEQFTQMNNERNSYEDHLMSITTMALAVVGNPADATLQTGWDKRSEALVSASVNVTKAAGAASEIISTMEANPQVNINQAKDTEARYDKRLLYAGVGLGGLAVLVVLLLAVRRRKRRKVVVTSNAQRVSNPLNTSTSLEGQANANTVIPPVQQVHQKVESNQEKLKYCPKCGHQLKRDAKFCNKCGNRLV